MSTRNPHVNMRIADTPWKRGYPMDAHECKNLWPCDRLQRTFYTPPNSAYSRLRAT